MPARRNARSLMAKPAGSMMCVSRPRQAARRRIVPVFWGMSGSNSAMRMGQLSGLQRTVIATKTQAGQTVCATFDRCDTGPHLPTCARLARVPIERRWIKPLGPLLAGGERPDRPPPPGGVSVSGVGGAAAVPTRMSCRSRRERAAGEPTDEKGTETVTTMSSAERTRRDFLYIVNASVAGLGSVATLLSLYA